MIVKLRSPLRGRVLRGVGQWRGYLDGEFAWGGRCSRFGGVKRDVGGDSVVRGREADFYDYVDVRIGAGLL